MDCYYSHIVDILTKNVGIDRDELFRLSGFTSKRAFLTEVNALLSSFRIAPIHERLIYAPRVLFLYESNKPNTEITKSYQLIYLPTKVLEKELGFIRKGTEPEHHLGYYLEIAGYELREEHKRIFEEPNNIEFDFNRFRYFLYAKYITKENTFSS